MRRPRHLALARASVVAMALALTVAPPAHADTEAARQFMAGTAAFDRGDFAGAARAFDAANAIAPAPAAVFNAARAWAEAGDRPRAADRYATFLDVSPPDVSERVTARRELARLRRELVVVIIEGPPEARASIAHVDGGVVPVATHLAPGSHTGTWSSGTVTGERFVVEGRAGREVRVTLRARDPGAPPAAPTLMTLEAHRAAPSAEGPADASGVNGLAVAGTSLLVLGVAGVGVGVGVGVAALGARDEFVEGGSVDAGLRAEADDLRTASNVTWVAGAAVGTLGLVLLVTALSQEEPAAASGIAGIDARGLTLRF